MESCPKCGMERRNAGPGSITQWISTCQCDELISADDAEQKDQILLCTSCNKRISAGRVGSLTQWVFRSDLCNCEKPSPVSASAPQVDYQVPLDQVITQEDNFEDYAVDADSFPTDRYRAVGEIGRGVSGIVYRARDRMLRKDVAIKCLKRLTASQLVSFQKEARATSKLNNPAIIKIFDFGALPSGAPYMVMEYVDGISLKQFIDENGPLPEQDALPVFVDLARALEHAHSRGIFHRDVKSSNVIVSQNKEHPEELSVRLIDFGVASLKDTMVGPTGFSKHATALVGTPPYMAPDQLNGLPVDARSEVYSLGCLFFESLTGRTPFLGETALDTLTMHANNPVPSLSQMRPDRQFSEEMEGLILQCLSKKPEERIQNMTELVTQLENLMGNPPLTPIAEEQADDTTYGDVSKQSNRLTVSTFASLLIGIGVLVCGTGTLLFNRLAPFGLSQTRALRPADPKQVLPPKVTDWTPEVAAEKPTVFVGNNGGASLSNGSDTELAVLARSNEFTDLQLIRGHFSATGISQLAPANLHSLSIIDASVDSKGLELIGQMRSLKKLAIRRSKFFTGAALRTLQGSTIEELHIDNTNLQDEYLTSLKGFPNLSSLFIAHCPKLTGSGFSSLVGTRLKHLVALELPALQDSCFVEIGKMSKHLETLSLEDTFFEEGKKDRISSDVFKSLPAKKPYDVEYFKHITAMPLAALSLDCDCLEEAHYDLISNMSNLSGLTLSGRRLIRPRNIEKLGKLPKLATLKLIGPCVERVGIQRLAMMPNLRKLILCDSEINDNDFNMFKKSKIVQFFVLGETSLSNVGLERISEMPSLRALRLPRVSFITPAGLKQFRNKKPGCNIIDEK